MFLGLDVLAPQLSSWRDKALFTPGPLTTSRTVKQAMLRDLGSRDIEFITIVKDIRNRLVALGDGVEEYTSVLMQGSGTFGIESVVSSVIPPDGKLLVLVNGAYGKRLLKIANIHKIPFVELAFPENTNPDPSDLEKNLESDPGITHVAAIHCETTTGIINPIEDYGRIVRKHNRTYIVDAMSSFGAYPIDLKKCEIDFLISSSNKNIEGVPGFSFVLARKAALIAAKGFARTLSLDLFAQWEGLEGDGQFRFTPPIHSILAFRQALIELEQEGGVSARGARYKKNYEATISAMQKMGFKTYLKPEDQGYIITSFYYPDHPNFNFQEFYERLSEKGHVIYPGKLTVADCFRIGHIGRLGLTDVKALMSAVAKTLSEMKIHISEKNEE
ncbi:MAG: 2-aminoethylphosphonate--pyruvate transaminase [Anaerolineales bacterium]|nr:2-aminoethylphosphonate--pyruvate transaminase [Anaerolineales bacterium]